MTTTRPLPDYPDVDRRRVRRLRFDPQILVDLCKHDDSPFRLQVTAHALDVFTNELSLVVQSLSFDVVGPEVQAPELEPTVITRTYEEAP